VAAKIYLDKDLSRNRKVSEFDAFQLKVAGIAFNVFKDALVAYDVANSETFSQYLVKKSYVEGTVLETEEEEEGDYYLMEDEVKGTFRKFNSNVDRMPNLLIRRFIRVGRMRLMRCWVTRKRRLGEIWDSKARKIGLQSTSAVRFARHSVSMSRGRVVYFKSDLFSLL
jgi:hypothetical protein